MSILVFDSGLGGLSILREVRTFLPGEKINYLADDDAFPYGDWEEGALLVHILSVLDKAIGRLKPKLVIVACNTASTLALGALREAHDIPFVGTVPAIKPAAVQTASGVVSVLATPGTIERQYTRQLIDAYAHEIYIRLIGSATLAALAENYLLTGQEHKEEVKSQILPCFVDRDGSKTDIVVLACTHYPFLINTFRKVAPWPVDWLDPAPAIAQQAAKLYGPLGQDESVHSPDHAYFTRDPADPHKLRLVAGFGLIAAQW